MALPASMVVRSVCVVTSSSFISENNVLLVDIGNTRIKYSLLCDTQREPNGCDSALSLFRFVDSQEKITHLYVASVRNKDWVDEIFAMCEARGIIFVEKHT